jgi:hypothetical protein
MLGKKGCTLLETNTSLKELLFEIDNAPKNSHERVHNNTPFLQASQQHPIFASFF